MSQSLIHVALVVRDYDEAIAWYTGVLGFELVDDTFQPDQGKRRGGGQAQRGQGPRPLCWPKRQTPHKCATSDIRQAGAFSCFWGTDDFWRDHAAYTAKGVKFIR